MAKRSNFSDLQTFVAQLRKENQLCEVSACVDAKWELPEIHRRVLSAGGPALLFSHVKGSSFPCVTNLFGSVKRIDIAFGKNPQNLIRDLVDCLHNPPLSLKGLWEKRSLLSSLYLPKKKLIPLDLQALDLNELPMLWSWPEDGGSFLTLPLVYTQSPIDGSSNLGIYRMQRFDSKSLGLHCQIGKGGAFHLHEAEQKGQQLPVSVFLGGPPILLLSALTPLPERVPELLLASFLQGEKFSPDRMGAEILLEGFVNPGEKRLEGPFGDHYGYYSLAHPYPVFHCERFSARKGALYPATVVGKGRQEDTFLGEYLQELLAPIISLVMPGISSIWSYGESSFHTLAGAIVKERHPREAMQHAFRILGEGQLSLTKCLFVTDQNVNLRKFSDLLVSVLERLVPQRDLFIFSNLCMDSLDYTGPRLHEGSRAIFLGLGKAIRKLPSVYRAKHLRSLAKIRPFCPGCLLLQAHGDFSDYESLLQEEDLQDWPLLVLVDDIESSCSEEDFLWTCFTRFEPAADIYSASSRVERHHILYDFPLLIDARMKASYPDFLSCDPDTKALVTKRWKEYFPQGMEMGLGD